MLHGPIWMLCGQNMAEQVRYKCDMHARRMSNGVKYGCYMHREWQIGSNMDVTCMKQGRHGQIRIKHERRMADRVKCECKL